MNDFGSQNGAKMEGKILGLSSREASENGLEIQPRFFVVLGRFWTPLGGLFGAFWASWESFGLPQAAFLVALRLLGPPRTCRGSAENWPKFSRELAEVPPRIRQEPAKNPPCEPQAKLPFTLRLLRMDCVLR